MNVIISIFKTKNSRQERKGSTSSRRHNTGSASSPRLCVTDKSEAGALVLEIYRVSDLAFGIVGN